MKLRLDLHTHCHEATGMRPLSLDIVDRIVEQIKTRGLDGIAITEHWDKNYGFQVKELVEQHFNNEVLIIPGQEVDIGSRQEIVLYLPNHSIFRFLAHPGVPRSYYDPAAFPDPQSVSNVRGIEVENGMNNWWMNKDLARQVAAEHDLLMLMNSDAHYLDRIGEFYNELELEELYARSAPDGW